MKALNVRNMRNTRQSGFTIIELVVVILLLGILSATALPRFMDVTTEAHRASVNGTYGGFATAAGIFRAQWTGKGQPTGAVPGFGNDDVFPSSNGSPASATDAAVDTFSECAALPGLILQGGIATFANALTTVGTAAQIAGAADTVGVDPADPDVPAGLAAGADYLAYFDLTSGNCQYVYVKETSKQVVATAPTIIYVPSTGDFSITGNL
ncbi:MAG: type II secretion system protein [Gammaproteobacteria bacterium]|nr:type II secretion system protein [Gammaproteobacteria bacterium]MBL4729190.1 type II secretion system protein [Gammaproteobacteria bacterium]